VITVTTIAAAAVIITIIIGIYSTNKISTQDLSFSF